MPEKTLLNERSVHVTTGRLVANGSTYNIQNIESVRVVAIDSDRKSIDAITKVQSQLKNPLFRFMYIGLLPAGGLVLGLLGGGWNWLWLPVTLVAAFLSQTLLPARIAARLDRLRKPYGCMIRLSGREVEAFRSDNEEFTRRAADAISDAVAETAG
jgi:hypothetical protein